MHIKITIIEKTCYQQNIILQNKGQIAKNQDDWWNSYIEAQLWAFYTMGISKSDSIFTEYEYAFTSFWMLISCVLFAYLINALGNILQDINSMSENYKKDLNVLNRYMKRKKIDIELQREMNTHLVKQYEQESQAQFDAEKEALRKLSNHMKNKLVTESNKNILQQFTFFNMFSSQTLQNIYQIMEEESYSEGQIIQTFEESTLDNFVYLILQGNVGIIQYIQIENEENELSIQSKDAQKIVKILSTGQQFGEFEFFSNTQMPYIVQSIKQAIVIKISRIKLVQIVSQNKIDYQKFMETTQRISMYEQMNVINSHCYVCNTQNHQFMQCNQVHFPKKSIFQISKYNFSPFQVRDQSLSRKIKKQPKYIVKVSSNLLIQDQQFENDSSSDMSKEGNEDETSIYKKGKQQGNNIKIKSSDQTIEEKSSDQQTSYNEHTPVIKY